MLPLIPASGGAAHTPSDILALVTSTSPWSHSVGATLALAARWGSHVTGCFIDPALLVLRGRDEEPSVLSLLLETPPEEKGVAEAFEQLAHRCGVRSAAWVPSTTSSCWIAASCGGDGSSELLGEALLGCRKPCLMLPPQRDGALAFGHVILAWNGSLEATRAIHAALPLLVQAHEAVVVDGAMPPGEDEAEVEPRFNPIEYLEQQDIVARRRRIHVSPHEAGDTLLHEAERMGSDLLVMGPTDDRGCANGCWEAPRAGSCSRRPCRC